MLLGDFTPMLDTARALVLSGASRQALVTHHPDDETPHGPARSKPPDMIVWHATEGDTLADAISWVDRVLQRGESPTSFHYGIAQDGAIARLVNPDLIAWHAGRSSYPGKLPADLQPWESCNARSIGIEMVTPDLPTDGLTSDQLVSGLWLAKVLQASYPTIRFHVAHREIAPGRKTDPDPAVLPMSFWRSAIAVVAPPMG